MIKYKQIKIALYKIKEIVELFFRKLFSKKIKNTQALFYQKNLHFLRTPNINLASLVEYGSMIKNFSDITKNTK